jgi:glutaredoxin
VSVNIKGLAMLIVNLYKKIILLLVSCTLFLSSCWESDKTSAEEETDGLGLSISRTVFANVSPIITTSSSPQKVKFAKFLSENNIIMYSAYWCPHCHDQKQLFGKEAVKELKVVECAKDGKDNEYKLCQTKGISGFPSWEINGEIISGTRDLNELATKTAYQGDLNF